MVVAVAVAVAVGVRDGGKGVGGGRGEGGSDLPGKAFYPVTRLDKIANFSYKAKPPS